MSYIASTDLIRERVYARCVHHCRESFYATLYRYESGGQKIFRRRSISLGV